MSSVQTISEVFNTEHYAPFVRFCQSRGLVKMTDLVDCPFDQLAAVPDIGPGLAMRIKNMVALYRRNHPEEFTFRRKKSVNQDEALAEKLESFFRSNEGRVLHIAEISKAVGAKRPEILRILADAPWCRTVDTTSFFFNP